jgi:hypothetical protein
MDVVSKFRLVSCVTPPLPELTKPFVQLLRTMLCTRDPPPRPSGADDADENVYIKSHHRVSSFEL